MYYFQHLLSKILSRIKISFFSHVFTNTRKDSQTKRAINTPAASVASPQCSTPLVAILRHTQESPEARRYTNVVGSCPPRKLEQTVLSQSCLHTTLGLPSQCPMSGHLLASHRRWWCCGEPPTQTTPWGIIIIISLFLPPAVQAQGGGGII